MLSQEGGSSTSSAPHVLQAEKGGSHILFPRTDGSTIVGGSGVATSLNARPTLSPASKDRFILQLTPSESKELKRQNSQPKLQRTIRSPRKRDKKEEKRMKSKSYHQRHNHNQTFRRRKKASFRVSLPQNFRNLAVTGLYGVALEVLMQDFPDWQVPPFIEQICLHIEEKMLDLEGIFRVTGNLSELKRVRDTLNDGKAVDFWEIQDNHVVCEMLKLYFRQLPEPLLTLPLYGFFLATTKLPENTCVEALRGLVNKLPDYNRYLLTRLCICMRKVTTHADKNKMDAANLGTVFGPNILRHPSEREVTDPIILRASTDAVGKVIRFFITDFDEIFKDVDYEPYYKCYVKVTTPYTQTNDDELVLKEGDMILVTDVDKRDTDGMLWYMGECHGKAGYFPAANCVFLDGTRCTDGWKNIASVEEKEGEDENKEEKEEKEKEDEEEEGSKVWERYTKEERKRRQSIREFLSYARLHLGDFGVDEEDTAEFSEEEEEEDEGSLRRRCATSRGKNKAGLQRKVGNIINNDNNKSKSSELIDTNVVEEGIVKARVTKFKEIEAKEEKEDKMLSGERVTRKTVSTASEGRKKWQLAVEQPPLKIATTAIPCTATGVKQEREMEPESGKGSGEKEEEKKTEGEGRNEQEQERLEYQGKVTSSDEKEGIETTREGKKTEVIEEQKMEVLVEEKKAELPVQETETPQIVQEEAQNNEETTAETTKAEQEKDAAEPSVKENEIPEKGKKEKKGEKEPGGKEGKKKKKKKRKGKKRGKHRTADKAQSEIHHSPTKDLPEVTEPTTKKEISWANEEREKESEKGAETETEKEKETENSFIKFTRTSKYDSDRLNLLGVGSLRGKGTFLGAGRQTTTTTTTTTAPPVVLAGLVTVRVKMENVLESVSESDGEGDSSTPPKRVVPRGTPSATMRGLVLSKAREKNS